jgi:hypothetical protein
MNGLLDALSPNAKEWVLSVTADDRLALLAAFSGAARKVGKEPCAVPGRGTWGADEVARAALLVRGAASVSPEELYDRGDNRERQAVLRALPLLDDAERFLPLAIEACRTNVLTIFEAIACENDYPQRFFPEPNWNQMVLKAAFNGVALARIVGVGPRRNAELARMATDFAAERRAAGRPVPADLARIMDRTRYDR